MSDQDWCVWLPIDPVGFLDPTGLTQADYDEQLAACPTQRDRDYVEANRDSIIANGEAAQYADGSYSESGQEWSAMTGEQQTAAADAQRHNYSLSPSISLSTGAEMAASSHLMGNDGKYSNVDNSTYSYSPYIVNQTSDGGWLKVGSGLAQLGGVAAWLYFAPETINATTGLFFYSTGIAGFSDLFSGIGQISNGNTITLTATGIVVDNLVGQGSPADYVGSVNTTYIWNNFMNSLSGRN